jgi:RNA polymerase sigma factor (sigma-70 family)
MGPAQNPRTRMESLTDRTGQPDSPRPEDLVRQIRAARATEASTEVNFLTEELLRACERGIQAVASKFYLPADKRDELRDRVRAKVWEKVSGDDSFWERHFGLALKRTALNEVLAMIRHRPFYDLADVPPALLGYGFHTSSNPVELNLRYARLRRCIDRLPQAEKRAVVLRHFHGLRIEADDESVPTVSGMLDVSPRTVRNYLARAATKLAECMGTRPGNRLR